MYFFSLSKVAPTDPSFGARSGSEGFHYSIHIMVQTNKQPFQVQKLLVCIFGAKFKHFPMCDENQKQSNSHFLRSAFLKNLIFRSLIRISGSTPITLWSGVHKGSIDTKKPKSGFSKNPDIPDPNFRFSIHGVEIRAPRATCSQNFRPLAALEAEMTTPETIIIY